MQYLYIDESGSMTDKYTADFPYFVVAIIRIQEKKSAKRAFRRFISKHVCELESLDTQAKMFENGKFKELKGSCLGKAMKTEFVEFMCKKGSLEAYFVIIDNAAIIPDKLYKNKARAFNYVVCLALKKFLESGAMPKDSYMLQIDERNEKTESLNVLNEYLNMELVMKYELAEGFDVKYFDSSDNAGVQIADVFANTVYSHKRTGAYTELLDKLWQEKYIRGVRKFP